MYTKVYGCVCWWSSYVSVYFFIRCWLMWLYDFWYGLAKGFSMYSLSLFVNPFIASRSYYVRFVDDSLTVSWHLMPWQMLARVLYYIHNGGYIWNDCYLRLRPSFCRASVSYSMVAMDGRSCSLLALVCWVRSVHSWLLVTCCLFASRREYVYKWRQNRRYYWRYCLDGHFIVDVCYIVYTTYSVCTCNLLANP